MSSYITPPPDYPKFIVKKYGYGPMIDLIKWAKKEHLDRLKFCAKHGYVREWTRLHNDYSPIRVLAEYKGLREICASITEEAWNKLTMRERVFIRRAYEMMELLRNR